MRRKLAALVALPLVVGPAVSAWADDDHERARAARERGEVLPLAELLERLEPVIGGDIVETEFEWKKGRWIYEIKHIDGQGRRVELKVDAATGRVLKSEVDD